MAPRTSRRRRPRAARWALTILAALAVGLAVAVPTGIAGRAIQLVAGAAEPGGPFDGPLPACQAADVPAVRHGPDDWDRVLLDPTYRLEPDDEPVDLVPVEEAGLEGQAEVRLLVIDDLRALVRAARADGVELRARSGFRSFADQGHTFASLERAHGRAFAEASAARPGHSEHQLGTALDLDGGDAWLAGNAWRFGFVVSYPPDRSPTFSCYKPEPWHVRYVGRDEARAVHDSGLTLREWLWAHAGDGR